MPTHRPVLCVCTSFALCLQTQAVLCAGCPLLCCSSAEIEHPDRCTISLAPDIVLADDVNRFVSPAAQQYHQQVPPQHVVPLPLLPAAGEPPPLCCPYKHTCREELLRLVQMGFHFKQIKQFIQQEQQPAVESSKSKYRCALCSGLDGKFVQLCTCQGRGTHVGVQRSSRQHAGGGQAYVWSSSSHSNPACDSRTLLLSSALCLPALCCVPVLPLKSAATHTRTCRGAVPV